MGLSDDLFVKVAVPCKAGRAIEALDDEDRSAVERALSMGEREKPTLAIARVMNDYRPKDDRIHPNTLRSHRRRECGCFPDDAR